MPRDRREFIQALGLGIGAVSLAGLTQAAACSRLRRSRPNVILIVADDLGYN